MRFSLKLTATLLLAVSAVKAQPNTAPQINCGVQSALALAQVHERVVTASQRAQLIESHPQATVSLADVKRIAATLGFNLSGVKATLDELTATQRPAIIHLTQPDHFVLLIDGDKENLRLLEKDNERLSVVPRQEIARRFDGYALIGSTTPVEAPRVRFDKTDVLFSNLTGTGANEKIERDFPFTNIGQSDLEVSVAGST